MMEWAQLFKTTMILVVILLSILLILFIFRRVMGNKGSFLGLSKGRGFQVLERLSMDPRRELVRIRDSHFEYTVLLGQTELLLDKRELTLEGGAHETA